MALNQQLLERAMYRSDFDGYRDLISAAKRTPMFARKTLDDTIMWDLIDGQPLHTGDKPSYYRDEAIALAIALNLHPKLLFGPLRMQRKNSQTPKAKNAFSMVSLSAYTDGQVHGLLARMHTPKGDKAELNDMRRTLLHIMAVALSPKEERIIRLYLGLGVNEAVPLKDIADTFGMPVKDIKYAYQKALLKLKHPMHGLSDFLPERSSKNSRSTCTL